MGALPPALRRSPLLVAFALFAVALGLWSFATPLWASPDEFQHVYRAFATVEGHIYIEPEPVLAGTLTCSEQPQGILTNLLLPYVRTGRLDQARDAHHRAYRLHRPNLADLGDIADHIE